MKTGVNLDRKPLKRLGPPVSPPHRAKAAALMRLFRSRRFAAAFTLMEVMIAAGIFFMAIFAILELVSNSLRNARALRRIDVDAGMVAAQLYKTNKLTEGIQSGDFGDLYPDYSWEIHSEQIQSNGLWQVDIVVNRRGLQKPVDAMSVWLYSPDSKSSLFNGGMRPVQ
jgi:hypothetical protein